MYMLRLPVQSNITAGSYIHYKTKRTTKHTKQSMLQNITDRNYITATLHCTTLPFLQCTIHLQLDHTYFSHMEVLIYIVRRYVLIVNTTQS